MSEFDYFEKLPLLDWDGVSLRNLLLRASVTREVVEKYGVFYPYRVKDNERMDTVAHDYYGDSRFFWLVAACNGVVDPYRDWPMSDADLEAHVREKYGSIEAAMAEVHHYESPDSTRWMKPETRAELDPADRVGFDVEKTCWDYEVERNESKKDVRLLSRKYARRALDELATVFFSRRA